MMIPLRRLALMTNYLKKDYNKDPFYNAGVIFIRIMLVFLILAAAAAVSVQL